MADGFRLKLLNMGITKIHYATHWFADQTEVECITYDEQDNLLPFGPRIKYEVDKALYGRIIGNGTYVWNLLPDTLYDFGDIVYLQNTSLHGDFKYHFESDEEKILTAASWTPEQPLEILEALAKDSEYQVRKAVMENMHTPIAILRPMFGDLEIHRTRTPEDQITKLELHALRQRASNPQTLPRDLSTLARSEFAKVRFDVGGNPSTSGKVLAELAKAPEWQIRLAVLGNSSCPPRVTSELLSFFVEHPDQHFLYRVAGQTFAPWTLLEKWVKHPDPNMRVRVAIHPNTPKEIVLNYIKTDPSREVRKDAQEEIREWLQEQFAETFEQDSKLAQQPNLSLEEQYRLADTLDHGNTDYQLALNPSVYPEVLEYLAKQPHTADWLPFDERLSINTLILLANSPNKEARYNVAKNKNLPEHLLRQLALDSYDYTRAEIASRLDCPTDVLEYLASDPSGSVKTALIKNPATPLPSIIAVLNKGYLIPNYQLNDFINLPHWTAEVLRTVAHNSSGDNLLKIALLPHAPADEPIIALLKETQEHNENPILFLLQRPDTSPSVLERLVGSSYDELLLEHPQFTPEVYQKLVDYHLHRYHFYNNKSYETLINKLISHPFASLKTIEQIIGGLYKDSRLELAQNPATPVSVLTSLYTDPNSDVLVALAVNPGVPKAIREKLWHDPALRNKLIPVLQDSPTLGVLASSLLDEYKAQMQRNPNLTANDFFEDHDHRDTLFGIAKNDCLPALILERLVNEFAPSDYNGATWDKLYEYWNRFMPETREKFNESHVKWHRQRLDEFWNYVSNNPSTPKGLKLRKD